jgi:serine/threonine-protein kinase
VDKLAAGETFGNYRIVGTRGEGGFATVYLAEDVRPAMSRRVALKVLDDRFASDPAFRERFTRESRLAANLDHPNIAPIFDAGEIGGRFYIAMRFVEGVDLKERLANSPLPPAEAIAVIRQIASALDYAHAQGLIHRDVKPGNVLLDHGETSRVYLADFGITKETADGKDFTQTGFFLGTLNYASPEQIGGQVLDGRSDQYALGCLLFEALTGRPPFEGNLQVVIGAHVSKPPPNVSDNVGGVPAAVDPVVWRAMAKEALDRFPSCTAMVDAAAAALSGSLAADDDTVITGGLSVDAQTDQDSTIVTPLDIAAVPRDVTTPEVPSPQSAVPSPVSAASVSDSPTPSRKGSRALLAIVGALVVLLLVGVAVLLLKGGSDANPGSATATTDVPQAASPPSTDGTTPTTGDPSSALGQFTGPTETIQPDRVAAPLPSAPGVDACEQPTTYEGEQLIDGNPTTAWRTTGDGTGRRITLNLGADTLVTSVGLINGLAKIDSCDGTDRYFDQRRVTAVQWTFDDGTTVTQDLDPSTKTMQTIEIESITTRVSVTILSTTPPGNRDFTPISEIEVQGVTANGDGESAAAPVTGTARTRPDAATLDGIANESGEGATLPEAVRRTAGEIRAAADAGDLDQIVRLAASNRFAAGYGSDTTETFFEDAADDDPTFLPDLSTIIEGIPRLLGDTFMWDSSGPYYLTIDLDGEWTGFPAYHTE